jgi:hypothetical protein
MINNDENRPYQQNHNSNIVAMKNELAILREKADNAKIHKVYADEDANKANEDAKRAQIRAKENSDLAQTAKEEAEQLGALDQKATKEVKQAELAVKKAGKGTIQNSSSCCR